MAVAVDAVTESVRTLTTDPHTFTHAGRAQASGGVQGVAVCVLNGTTATDEVNAVTYGGVNLTRKIGSADTVTEPGRAQIWWADAVPGGTQTVSVDFTSATGTDQEIVVVTYTGGAALEVIDTDLVQENAADPQVTLNHGGRSAHDLVAIYSGAAAPTDLTVLSGMTAVFSEDFGNFVSRVDRSTSPGTSDFTIGYTALTDDVALAAIAVAEYVPSGTSVPYVNGSNNGGNSNTPSVVLPTSGLAPGDHVLIQVNKVNAAYTTAAPSGYTLVQSLTDGTNSAFLFKKAAAVGADLGATVTFDIDAGGVSKWSVLAVVYRGGDPTNFVTQSDLNSEAGTDTTHPSPSMAITDANSTFVAFISERGSGNTGWTQPTGMALRQANYQTGGGPESAGAADKVGWGSTGASGGQTWTQAVAASSDKVGFSVEIAPFVALTAVGKTTVMKWNVRAPAGATSIDKWNVRAPVGKTTIAVWNVRTFVGLTRQYVWNVRTSVGLTRVLKWNVRAPVGPTVIAKWNVRAAVGKTTVMIWNVRVPVGLTRVYRWAVRTSVGATSIDKWNVRAPVGKTLTGLWNVRAAVGKVTVAVWHVRAATGRTTAFLWNVRAPVGLTRVYRWNVRAAVGSTIITRWNVRAAVGLTRLLKWNVRANVGQTVTAKWNVRQAVGLTRTYIWNVLVTAGTTAVGKTTVLVWNVRAPVGATSIDKWNVRRLISPNLLNIQDRDFEAGYTVGTVTTGGVYGYFAAPFSRVNTDSHSGSWSIQVVTDSAVNPQGLIVFAPASQALPSGTAFRTSAWVKMPAGVTFQVGHRAIDPTTGAYGGETPGQQYTGTGAWQHVETRAAFAPAPGVPFEPGFQMFLQPAQAGITFYVDDVEVAVMAVRTLAWNVRAAVGQAVTAKWNVRAVAGLTRQYVWNVRQAVGVTRVYKWNVRAAVGKAVTALWNVRAAVGITRTYRWAVRTSVGLTRVYPWNVRAAVGQAVTARWNVRAAVGKTTVGRWNVRAAVGVGRTYVWNVRRAVGKSTVVRWNVRAAVGRTVTALWDVLTNVIVLPWTRFGADGSSASRDEPAQSSVSLDDANGVATSRDEASSGVIGRMGG